MAYEYGSASDQDDLLDKLRTFLVADGWSVNDWSASGNGYRLHVVKSGLYANFRSCSAEAIWGAATTVHSGLAMNVSTGYTGVVVPTAARGWSNEPGGPCYLAAANQGVGVHIGQVSGAISQYWFFANGVNVDVIVEISVGVFGSLHFGMLEKFGTFTGGEWFAGSGAYNSSAAMAPPFSTYYRSFARLEHVDNPHYWHSSITGANAGIIAGVPTGNTLTVNGCAARLIQAGVTVGGVAPLIPLYFATASPNYFPLGYAAQTRVCRREYLSVGEEITIGADTWVATPTADTAAPTAQIAMAVKKVV